MTIAIKRRRVAAALLATAALGGGLLSAGPADAAGTHTVTIQANPGINHLYADVTCDDPNGVGTSYSFYGPMYANGRLSVPGVPDGYDCNAYVEDDNTFANYSDGFGTAAAITSDVTITVNLPANASFRATGFSTISGVLAVSSTVTAVPGSVTNGSFAPGSLTYTWYRVDFVGGAPQYTLVQSSVPGTNNSRYTLTEADYGHQMVVDVGGTNAAANGGSTVSPGAISNPVGRLGTPAPGRPGIRGVAKVGHRLAARTGTPPTGSSLSGYQWYYEKIVKKGHRAKVVFVKIRGAKHRVYKLRKRDKGKLIVVAVTYTRPSFNPTIIMSRPKRVH